MDTDIFHTESRAKYLVLAGAESDISKFSFKGSNLKILKVGSQELIEFCDSSKYEGWANNTLDYLNELKKKYESYNLFLIVQDDFAKPYCEEDFYTIFDLLLILFPSELQIVSELDFQVFDSKYLHKTQSIEVKMKPLDYERPFKNFLYFDEEELNDYNRFIEIFFKRYKNIQYLKAMIKAYISSYYERNPLMAFLCLCMALESVVSDQIELSYRITRNVTMLCSKKKHHAILIFNNLKLIYKLRSKIVHGSDFNDQIVVNYLPYLRNIVSRLIVELVLQNCASLDELNHKLTFAGYGDKSTLSDDYYDMELSASTYHDSILRRLENK